MKQGGLAAQQAEAAAEAVIADLGLGTEPQPFRPVLRGMLFTGGDESFMRTSIAHPGSAGAVAGYPLWWPPTKITGRRLAPYLFVRSGGTKPGPAPAGFEPVERPLTTGPRGGAGRPHVPIGVRRVGR